VSKLLYLVATEAGRRLRVDARNGMATKKARLGARRAPGFRPYGLQQEIPGGTLTAARVRMTYDPQSKKR